jgi:pimeloyl-ACP methyl ester carboxylesterase
MSSDAYLPPAEASAAFKRLGFLSTTSIVDGSMVSYVVTGRDVVVIVFRGTDDEPDWIVNLDSIPTNTPDGRIHEGFYDAYQTLRNEVVRAVRSGRPKYVWITGHSLGGALAVVCAYKCLADDQIDVTGLVTFGQPMVTMGKLADYFNTRLLGRYVHFVNESDLVPRVPPFFSHCGSLVWFKDGGIKRSKPKRTYGSGKATRPNRLNNSDEIPPMSELEFRELKRRLRVKSLRKGKPVYEGSMLWFGDHSMDCYLEKLHKIIGPG